MIVTEVFIIFYYVFLKEIDRIIKEKGKENLNDLEEIKLFD